MELAVMFVLFFINGAERFLRLNSKIVSLVPRIDLKATDVGTLLLTAKTVMTMGQPSAKRQFDTYLTNEAPLASISLLTFSECG